MISKKVKITVLAAVLTTAGANAKSIDINGEKISENEIKKISQDYMRIDYESASKDEKEEIINKIVDFKIVLKEAKEKNIENDKKYKDIIKVVKDMVLIQVYTEKEFEKFNLKKEDLREYYEKNTEEFEGKKIVNASHIVVETEQKAKNIIEKLKNSKNIKEDFENLAKKYSTGPSSVNGGKLGWFSRGKMVPSFENAAFELNNNQFTKEPVKTRFGYHIIMLNDIKKTNKKTYEQFEKEYKKNPEMLKQYKEEVFANKGYDRMEELKKNKYKINIME